TGNREGAVVERLSAAMPTGTLEATGRIGWSPSLAWTADATLAGFDPGYFLPDWNGAVNGSLATTGRTRADEGMDMRFDLQRLGRSEEHTSELQSRENLVCRLLLEKKKS